MCFALYHCGWGNAKCSSVAPTIFRRQAIAHMATNVHESDTLIFPYRRHTRLRISIVSTDGDRFEHQSPNVKFSWDESDLNAILHSAQQEIIEQEIFSLLVKEAANLPTASARVSEMAVFIDAAPGMELQFELVRGKFPRQRLILIPALG